MEPLGGAKPHRASCRPSARQRKRRLQSCSDSESCASAGPPLVHKRCRRAARNDAAAALPPGCQLSLYVRWQSATGAVKVNRLPLDPIGGVDDLRGLFRRLIKGAFPPGGLPDYLTSPAFYKFSPAEELISLPGDIARSEFRLVATLGDGWEYTVCERTLPGAPDPERRLLVTLAEFESEAVVVGDRRYVARLLSYPTVCVRRDFLDDTLAQLAAEAEYSADACGAPSQGPSSPADMPPEEPAGEPLDVPTAEAAAAAAALGGLVQLSGSALQESAAETQPELGHDSELEAAAELELLGRLAACQPAEGAASGAAGGAATRTAHDTAASPCVSAA